MKSTIVIILSLGVALSSQLVLQDPKCPDLDWLNENSTNEEIVINHLKKNGPADGVCESTKDKWIYNGEQFGLPSKCVCINIPTKPEIKPGQGERCSDWKLVSPKITPLQSFKENYENNPNGPPDGWCPEGEIKWVTFSDSIGVPNDTCYCFKDYRGLQ